MTDKKVHTDDELQAWGELTAEVPQVEELVAYYKRLSRNTNPVRRRKLVLRKARELGLVLGGNRLLDGPEISQRVLDASLWDALRLLLDGAPLLFGPMTVQQLLLWVSAVGGLDDAVYAWVERTAQSGRAAPYPEGMRGGSIPFAIPALSKDDEPTPIVLCAVTPHTDMDSFIADLRDKTYETFKDYSKRKPATVAEAAHIFAWLKQGKTRPEIAWLLLAERFPEIAAADDETRKRDYAVEYKKELARLRQMIHRL